MSYKTIEPPRLLYMVPKRGLEPPRLAALDPKSSVSTNSTTSAKTTNVVNIE